MYTIHLSEAYNGSRTFPVGLQITRFVAAGGRLATAAVEVA